ncbi:hypothetical protein QBC33DRAFT_93302 [Phialemonium atrogriseum]|uniref:Uncharacterized protein n=1 Tax=Phialemonium atrogriseum TaxID=1093897 RepID=A0AAJ0BZX3_9PEZI|nr:uncharacterized protein QBC33DRAFT_93302 [Phialemonium atrogriseum]KAK1766907.1 hypothetical protein QBC33DRAFT_93302 [Phialemonium atrogriseum]
MTSARNPKGGTNKDEERSPFVPRRAKRKKRTRNQAEVLLGTWGGEQNRVSQKGTATRLPQGGETHHHQASDAGECGALVLGGRRVGRGGRRVGGSSGRRLRAGGAGAGAGAAGSSGSIVGRGDALGGRGGWAGGNGRSRGDQGAGQVGDRAGGGDDFRDEDGAGGRLRGGRVGGLRGAVAAGGRVVALAGRRGGWGGSLGARRQGTGARAGRRGGRGGVDRDGHGDGRQGVGHGVELGHVMVALVQDDGLDDDAGAGGVGGRVGLGRVARGAVLRTARRGGCRGEGGEDGRDLGRHFWFSGSKRVQVRDGCCIGYVCQPEVSSAE